MAKSVGNIARVGELLETGISPRALRYALISVHYRATLNHSEASLAAAAAGLDRLDAAVAALGAYEEDRPDDATLGDALAAARERFGAALDDDLNISAGLAAVHDLVRELNRRIDARGLSTADADRALAALRDLDEVLGVLPEVEDELAADVRALLDERAAARAARDWAASDRLRDALVERGIAVEDTRDGQRWRRLTEAVTGG
jgi:cysteinyl-tRNA synthetase